MNRRLLMRDFHLFLFRLFVIGFLGWNPLHLRADTVDVVGDTQANLLEVLKLRETRSGEVRAWKEQKELMRGQLELDRQALEILERELEAVEPQLNRIRTESDGLQTGLEIHSAVVAFWKDKLDVLSARLGEMVDRFPPGLRQELTGKLQDLRVPREADASGQVRRLFDGCLEVISRANDFHKDIHLLTELHALSDGRQGLFTVVYLGLSGGYYFSERSGRAGIIRWDGTDWRWEEKAGLLEDLLLLKAVVSGREPPRFLTLPFVNHGEGTP